MKNNISRSFLSRESIREYRDNNLRNFIEHAVKTTPYYAKLFTETGVSSKDIQSLNDLEKIPVLDKRDVQNYFWELQAVDAPRKNKILINTSGTTGTPLNIYTTDVGLMELYAIWGRYYHWHGITPCEDWCAVFGARPWVNISQKSPPFWRYNHFGRQILFSGFHMTQDNIKYYISEIRKRKPP
ncbi:MAG: hypothetical protein ACP5VS_19315 [Desulfomonilaceae bacterium]